jgi:Fic family protein
MLGIDRIYIEHETLLKIAHIERFNGVWLGLNKHTTALSLLSDVAAYGRKFSGVLEPLRDQKITVDVLNKLHAHVVNKGRFSGLRTADLTPTIMGIDGKSVEQISTADPADIRPLLEKLLNWIDQALTDQKIHPLLSVSAFASIFVQISPYPAGNQALMRFLVTLYLLKAGYEYVPYAALEPLMREEAAYFVRALKHNQRSIEDEKPDWSVWAAYFLDLLTMQADLLWARLENKKKDLAHLPTLSRKIMALFEKHERLQMKQIVKLTKGQRSTLKLRLGELVEEGYLRRHGQARSTWYSLS